MLLFSIYTDQVVLLEQVMLPFVCVVLLKMVLSLVAVQVLEMLFSFVLMDLVLLDVFLLHIRLLLHIPPPILQVDGILLLHALLMRGCFFCEVPLLYLELENLYHVFLIVRLLGLLVVVFVGLLYPVLLETLSETEFPQYLFAESLVLLLLLEVHCLVLRNLFCIFF